MITLREILSQYYAVDNNNNNAWLYEINLQSNALNTHQQISFLPAIDLLLRHLCWIQALMHPIELW